MRWKDTPPPDKDEWIRILREVLAGTRGSYRIWFYQGPAGWKFDFDWRAGFGPDQEQLPANGPEALRFNVYQRLSAGGKPMDPDWRSP